MIKKILSWFLLALLAAYVVAAAVWARGEAMKNTCKGINIDIAQTVHADSVSKKGVLAEIKRYPEKLVGARIQLIDTKKFENYLRALPQFEDVSASFTTDGELRVRITPMVPEIRIFEDSVSYYINKDGKKMASKASYFVDVPVVSGHFDDKFRPKDVLPVTRFIENDEFLSKLVSMVRVEDADNIILVPRINGHVINLGDTNRLGEKKEALLAIYRKVIPHKGWEEYDTISVKFRGQVVATRRNKGYRQPEKLEFEETDMEEATLPELLITENQTQ